MLARMVRTGDLAHTLTNDGWRIAAHVFEPQGPKRRRPVVLCHGLAANHLAFDVHADVSLARHLARRGYLALAIDLRGHGHSEHPTRAGARRFGWSFDDYLERDVPAAIAMAKQMSGASEVHWIGHSMGGILGYVHIAHNRDLASMTAVGSSLDYSASDSGFHALAPLRALLDRIPHVPVGLLAKASGALVGRASTPYEKFNVWATNTDLAHWRRIATRGFHRVSSPVMAQLASAMQPGGLRSRDGSRSYVVALGDATTPVLALAGDRDPQCPPDAARRTLEAVGSKDKKLVVFGPNEGHGDHYGHFDLLIGRRAKEEVFPHIDGFLDDHD